MTPIVETQRLRLREFSQDDLDDLAAMVADEDQMAFYPRPKTRRIIHPDHTASRRVAEKIEMEAERATILYDDYAAVIYTAERS